MTEPYADEECHYLGGDPRLEDTGAAEVHLQEDCIRLKLRESHEQDTVLLIPKAAIQGVRAGTQRLGMEQAEHEEGVLIGPDECITRYIAIVDVKDPEGVVSGALQVRLAFRNEYFSKLFEKRCRETYDLPPF